MDFKKSKVDVVITPGAKVVSGTVTYTFDVLKPTDSIYLDAIRMAFSEVKLNGNSMTFSNDNSKLWIKNRFEPSANNEISFSYKAQPKIALYFIDSNEGNKQIWTQGQGKYTSNWLPSVDDMNDKIEFDLSVSYDKGFEVVANGELVNVEEFDSTKTWHFNMDKPMSSYLVALAIGKYNKKTETSKSGIPLDYYYYPQDSLKVEPTYRYSKQMFDFLEEEIGVPYPWEIYKQVPVKDFLYSGMENTTLTIFSDALVTDSIGFNDRNYVNVNAHELAHQWFGNLVTATSGTHHWLQEGFATYFALLAERDIFGENYYYWQLYEYAQQLLEQEKAGESTSLLDPKSSSLTFYQKGCWALHILKEQVGEEAFRAAIKNYLLKHQFANVETSDFIGEVEKTSGQDLSGFVSVWLESVELPQDAMVKSLKKSEFLQEYMDVSCETHPSKCQDYLVSDISDKAKVKIISQESYRIKKEDFNNSREVRQALALNLTEIPLELKISYESLLHDKSYITKEAALYNLWVNFPQERVKYLEQTKSILGFNDYNVRLLWLALNLNTIEYQPKKKQAVFDELKGYTGSQYNFGLRMNAFNYLKLINGFDELSIENLDDATIHHNWRFQQFAKSMLNDLKQNEIYKEIIQRIENRE
ncbi:MAG TPA: M1 family metallopeptidase [Aquaticitalea sp.]|nr:M1 family metallopeptidase [Aquaticitalea sp.]